LLLGVLKCAWLCGWLAFARSPCADHSSNSSASLIRALASLLTEILPSVVLLLLDRSLKIKQN
jgi:hypothetical protein